MVVQLTLFSSLRTSFAQAAGDPALQAPGNPVVQALCDLAPGDPNFQAPGDTTSIAPVANGNPARANTALVNNTSHVPTTDMVDSAGTAALFQYGILRCHPTLSLTAVPHLRPNFHAPSAADLLE
jgi:hypothetical protein